MRVAPNFDLIAGLAEWRRGGQYASPEFGLESRVSNKTDIIPQGICKVYWSTAFCEAAEGHGSRLGHKFWEAVRRSVTHEMETGRHHAGGA